MKILSLALCLALVGCATTAPQIIDKPVAVSYKYVVVKIPDELLEVPDQGPKIDPETATDKDAALWMTTWESRYQTIEKRLKSIKAYQDRRLQELKLPADAVIQQ